MLSRAEYQEQGNAICARAIDEVEDVPEPRSPDAIADYVQEAFGLALEANEELAALGPPDALRADHEKLVKLSEGGEAELDRLVEQIRRADDPRATFLRELRKTLEDPEVEQGREITRRLGLDECLEVGAPAPEPEAS